jgi:hypothetical protein
VFAAWPGNEGGIVKSADGQGAVEIFGLRGILMPFYWPKPAAADID